MKKMMLCVFLVSFFVMGNAQLRVQSDGRVQVGSFMENQDVDNVLTLQMLGKYGDMHAGSKFAFGDFGRYMNQGMNVFIGEYSTDDTDQLWLHGKLGFFLTATGYANKVIASYNPATNTNFVFNTNLVVNGVSVTSDARMKENIQSIENPLETLSLLDGVSYTYSLSEIEKAREPETDVFSGEIGTEMATSENTAMSEKEKEYLRIQQEIDQREAADANRKRMGFLAQDVQKVLPELVQTDEKGMMSIDYTGFIPLIVESIKQMQQTIQAQQEEIETLRSLLPEETRSGFRSTSNEKTEVVAGAKLYNRAGASISYTLPVTYSTADLQVFDISGRLLKKVALTGNNSVVDIDEAEIGLGTFIYTLFVDGKKADTLKKYVN